MTTESSKNGAITLTRMKISRYIGQVTTFSWMLTTSCCLVVGLGFGLDLACGWLTVMHTYSYYFPLSLSLSRLTSDAGPSRDVYLSWRETAAKRRHQTTPNDWRTSRVRTECWQETQRSDICRRTAVAQTALSPLKTHGKQSVTVCVRRRRRLTFQRKMCQHRCAAKRAC